MIVGRFRSEVGDVMKVCLVFDVHGPSGFSEKKHELENSGLGDNLKIVSGLVF